MNKKEPKEFKKLRKMGFDCVYSSLYGPSFLKKVLDEDGKMRFNHRVDVIRREIGGEIVVQSYISGRDCTYGYSCAYPLTGPEMVVFNRLARRLKRKWRREEGIARVKSRVFGAISSKITGFKSGFLRFLEDNHED